MRGVYFCIVTYGRHLKGLPEMSGIYCMNAVRPTVAFCIAERAFEQVTVITDRSISFPLSLEGKQESLYRFPKSQPRVIMFHLSLRSVHNSYFA